jgi:hypothetical protein
MFGFSSFSETPFSALKSALAVIARKDFYVEGVKVKKKVKEIPEKYVELYDEELAILMLMAA